MNRSDTLTAWLWHGLNVLVHAGIIAIIVIVAWQLGAGLDSPLLSALVAALCGVCWGWVGREILWPTGR